MNKKQIKRLYQSLAIKKELSLLLLGLSFFNLYNKNSETNEVYRLSDSENSALKELIIKTRSYKSYLRDVLKVAENEMELVEKLQRQGYKRHKFARVCEFNNDDDLIVNGKALYTNLFLIHQDIKGKNINLSKNLYNLKYDDENSTEYRNATIIATEFYHRINAYYDRFKVQN